MHMSLSARLRAREQELGRPVRIGLAGAGQMGMGFVAQVQRIPGMETAAIADVLPGRPKQAFAQSGVNGVVEGDDLDTLAQAVADGRPVGMSDARMLVDLPVDVVVDATGVPDIGAWLSYAALTGGKDVATLNAEADVTIGLLLSRVARASGQVYALCKGDEPVEVNELFDYVTDLGFEVVCAGKGKNNPLRPHDTPESVADEAAAKHMNPKMLASFVDGTKTMIECASMANAIGLELSRRGMYGPETTVPQLAHVFPPAPHGGGLLPLGVAARATVVRDVAIDQALAYEDVELDESSTILQLRRLQDQLL